MKLTFIGSGYVGLVSGACFAELGHNVTCVDNDHEKIRSLQAGKIPFFEPGLEELVSANSQAGRLRFSDDTTAASSGADAVFLCVGTPSRIEDGEADLSYVFAAVDAVSELLDDGSVLISKSTVPVGTGEEIEERVERNRAGIDVHVVSCPEFLREGSAIADFMEPHRIVIGAETDRGERVMREIYRPLVDAGFPFLAMKRRSAELSKYAANAFLATRLAFINEMADLAENVSADIEEVAKAMGLDPRIGEFYLRAGPGFGGSCFPKDAMALHRKGEDVHAALRIVETVIAVNEQRKRSIANRVIEACGGSVDGKSVAILGVTFKPDTDDLRDSPSIPLIRRLVARGARIKAYDPGLPGGAPGHPDFADVVWCGSAYEAADEADVTVIVTDWSEFRDLDLHRLAREMAEPRLVDLRNLFQPSTVASAGLDYISIGREPTFAEKASTDMTATERSVTT